MRGIGRNTDELPLHIAGHRAVHHCQRRPPWMRQLLAQMGQHVGLTAHIGLVVEGGVAEQHDMPGSAWLTGLRPGRASNHAQPRSCKDVDCAPAMRGGENRSVHRVPSSSRAGLRCGH